MACPNSMTIVQAISAMRDGALTSRKLLSSCLESVRAGNKDSNALICVNDKALERAEALDREAAGGRLGPLHGIPLVVKDNIDAAGLPTTMAAKLFLNAPPAGKDSGAVARLKAAGAIILGKANMDTLASYVSGFTSDYGIAVNPWHAGEMLTPGGSSGGTAVAVAARYCLGGVGSDTGGSIRLPAAWCGIAGFRPTPGQISLRHCYPRAASLDVIGPMARSAEDAALLFSVMRNFPGETPPALPEAPRQPRVGLFPEEYFAHIQDSVLKSFRQAVENWKKLGAAFERVILPSFSSPEVGATLNIVRNYEFARDIGADFPGEREQSQMHPFPRSNVELGRSISIDQYLAGLQKMREYARQAEDSFRGMDFILLPAVYSPAIPLAAPLGEYAKAIAYLEFFSLAGLPTLVLPGAPSESGLPIGFQMVGCPGSDYPLLALGVRYEAEYGPFALP